MRFCFLFEVFVHLVLLNYSTELNMFLYVWLWLVLFRQCWGHLSSLQRARSSSCLFFWPVRSFTLKREQSWNKWSQMYLHGLYQFHTIKQEMLIRLFMWNSLYSTEHISISDINESKQCYNWKIVVHWYHGANGNTIVVLYITIELLGLIRWIIFYWLIDWLSLMLTHLLNHK